MYGFWQKIAGIDLFRREIQFERLDEKLYQTYFAGSGLAVQLLYQSGTYGADPVRPENDLKLIPGLLTGTPIFTASRTSVRGRSPLTGIWEGTNFGGWS